MLGSMSEEARLDWAEKYRPARLADVVGNDAAVKALRRWAETFGSGKKAAILYGGPGIGKTSAALALARDMGWDYVEMNASDQRTKDAVNRIAGAASKSGTFGGAGERRLLVLDEADNLHGNYDRGGEAAIIGVIKNTDQPIILIANDFYALSRPLRDAAEQIPFRALLSASIVKALKRVCAAEAIRCQPEALMKIAERTSDLRSALNDLQAAAMGRDEVTLADVATGDRDVPESIFRVMGLIFRGDDPGRARRAVMELDESPEDLVGWVDENLPREYRDDDLERGFDALSRADVYLGRVRRRMDYGMWRYASFMMVAGVNRSRRRRYGGYTRYSAPTYWQKLGRARGGRALRDSLAAKIGGYCHTSRREARAYYLPLLRALFADEENAAALAARLRLDEDEITFLLDAEKPSKKAQRVHAKSRELAGREAEREIDAFARFARREDQAVETPKPTRKRGAEKARTAPAPVPEEPKKEEPPAVPPEGEAPAEPRRQRTLFDF